MSTPAFDTVITQARDLLRWRSPLRTELWAARLTAELQESGQAEPFLRRLREDGGQEARLTLAALAAVGGAEGPDAARALPGWVHRMGRVTCEGGWYGKADAYGEQVLAVLSFRYENGKEPHILVVGLGQPQGGLAVDALVEETTFLDDLGLRPADPGVAAGRILDALELGDQIMGAAVAGTLPGVRPLATARALTVPGLVRGAPDDTVARFEEVPDLPGAREAFAKLAEFLGDRPLWWSPARVSQFLTSWLPREAILSEAAIEAMPEVVRAWTRYCGDQPAVLRQIDEDAPRLPALMADESLAGLGKRLALRRA
ncbi:hypothetical protein ACIBP6_02685 [Nonomuraea terrae]|uniref:hypothetical protein n=1 Tax=Nonomuraea terrae TaxID=2530383 RepID=UPI0037BADC52